MVVFCAVFYGTKWDQMASFILLMKTEGGNYGWSWHIVSEHSFADIQMNHSPEGQMVNVWSLLLFLLTDIEVFGSIPKWMASHGWLHLACYIGEDLDARENALFSCNLKIRIGFHLPRKLTFPVWNLLESHLLSCRLYAHMDVVDSLYSFLIFPWKMFSKT